MHIYDYDDSSLNNLVFGNTLHDSSANLEDNEAVVFRYPEFLNPTLFQSLEFTKFTTDNYSEALIQSVLAGKEAAEKMCYYDSQRFNTDIANRCRNVFRNIFEEGELFNETDTMTLFLDNNQIIQKCLQNIAEHSGEIKDLDEIKYSNAHFKSLVNNSQDISELDKQIKYCQTVVTLNQTVAVNQMLRLMSDSWTNYSLMNSTIKRSALLSQS